MTPPKYNIGDEVWKVVDNKCESFTVSGITLEVTFLKEEFWKYSVAEVVSTFSINIPIFEINHRWHPEDDFFPSKEKLLEHLTNTTT